jgi:hypothetical protein
MCSFIIIFATLVYLLEIFFHYSFFVFVSIVVIYGHVGDELVVVLKVNDNFTFNAKEGNDEGVTLCIEPLHKVKESFIDN